MNPEVKLPTLEDIINETPISLADNKLLVLLNSNPPAKWLRKHPTAQVKNSAGEWVPLQYIPIEKIEYTLTKIYGHWQSEIRSVHEFAQSVIVVVRVTVINPVTMKEEWQDGVGGCMIEKGSSGSQIAPPAAESFAFKDAVEKFGKIFGKDLGRAETMDYTTLLKSGVVDENTLAVLYKEKESLLSADEKKSCLRVIDGKEHKSYKKINELLNSKK